MASKMEKCIKTLVVEDEAISRELLMKVVSGYGIVHDAANGLIALDKFQGALRLQEPYDLICLDIMMPEMNGQETLKKIRQIEADLGIAASDRVAVVMVTALGDTNNIVAAYGSGACQAYLTKPVSHGILKGQLQELGLVSESD